MAKKGGDYKVRHKLELTGEKEYNASLKKIEQGIRNVGSQQALTGAAVYAGKKYLDLEDAMAMVYTLPAAQSTDQGQMTADLLDASDEVGIAAKELAEASYQAISAGADAGKAVGFVKSAGKAAKAGMTDATTAIDGATSAMNAWKISYDQADVVFGKFLTAQNEGKTTLGEVAGQIGQITGLAPSLNVSLDETLASVAALTKNGVQTSSAITGLKNVMAAVLKPTSEARKEAKKLGLEFDAAALKSKGLTGFLAEIQAKTGGSEEKISKLFGSVEGLSQVLLMSGAAAKDYADILGKMGSSAGVLDDMFSQRTSSNAEKMKKSLNQLNNTAIRFGQTMSPAIDLLTGGLQSAADWLGSLNREQMQSLTRFAMMAAGIGPVTAGLGKLTSGFGKVNEALAKLGKAPLKGGPILMVAAAVAAVSAGVIALKNHLESLKGVNKLKAAFSEVTVDTSKVQEAVDAASGTEYQFDIVADAQIKLKDDLEESDGIIEPYFEKGKKPSRKKQNEYRKSIETMVDEYVAIANEVGTQKASELAAALQVTGDELADYAIKISNSVKPPLDEELAYFEELKQKLIETGSAILELSNQTVNATQGAYIRVTEGGSTSSKDIAQASAYLSGQKLIDTKKRKDEWSDTQNSLNAQIIANQGDGAKVAELTAQMQAEEAAFNADCQAIAEKYTQDMGNMWEAIAKAYPEQVELAKGILASQNQVDLISEALGVWDNTDGNDEAAAKKAKEKIAATYQQIFGEAMFSDNYGAAEQRLREQMDAIKASMAANVENTDFSDVFTAFSAAVEGGLLENLDLSSASDGLKAMITAIDLSDDGKTMGEQLAAGQVEGIVAGTPEAEKAILENVKAICDGFKTPMEISSPSGVFERYGGYIMEGLKNGLQGGRKTVLSPLDTLTADLSLIGQNAVGGLITGADSRKQELIDAYAALGRSAAKAVRDELDIHSPSRVFAKIGIYSAEGMIAGLNARVRDVHAAMAQIADINAFSSKSRRQNDIAKAAMQSQEGQAGQPIQIIVNYTGAVSSRESRKLAQQLGGYLSGQLSVRGI